MPLSSSLELHGCKYTEGFFWQHIRSKQCSSFLWNLKWPSVNLGHLYQRSSNPGLWPGVGLQPLQNRVAEVVGACMRAKLCLWKWHMHIHAKPYPLPPRHHHLCRSAKPKRLGTADLSNLGSLEKKFGFLLPFLWFSCFPPFSRCEQIELSGKVVCLKMLRRFHLGLLGWYTQAWLIRLYICNWGEWVRWRGKWAYD